MNQEALETILEKLGYDTDETIELTIDELFEIVEAFNGPSDGTTNWEIPVDGGNYQDLHEKYPFGQDTFVTVEDNPGQTVFDSE